MTADVKNIRAFEAMIETRKAMTAAVQQANEVMKKSGNAQGAVNELRRIAKAKGGSEQSVILSEIADRLSSNHTELSEEIAHTEMRAAFYAPHTAVRPRDSVSSS